MHHFDLTPLHRFTVGFDNMARLLDNVSQLDDSAVGYPPYNIEKFSEDDYRITMAVAGFAEHELDITQEENSLTIAGRKETAENSNSEYLHRGIAKRAFERKFELAGHIKVREAKLENGLLHVDLYREIPEELKPRKIAINGKLVENSTLENNSKKASKDKDKAA